jgi:hypothetical protein
VAGGEGPRAAHPAARRAETTRQAETPGKAVAERRSCVAEAGARKSCLELGLCGWHHADGRALRILTLLDEYTRECLAVRVERRWNSLEVVNTQADGTLRRGIPPSRLVRTMGRVHCP